VRELRPIFQAAGPSVPQIWGTYKRADSIGNSNKVIPTSENIWCKC